MRVPGGGNTLLVISLLFSLLLLNYFNLVPLSKLFPFLSFLPEKSVDEISKTAVVPTPTPLPPITIKKIDPVKKTGEFVINDPSPKLESLSLEKQIIIDGIYDTNTKKVAISASVQSSRPIHKPPLLPPDSSSLYLEQVSEGKVIFSTDVILFNLDNRDNIPFSINLPYLKKSTINIYDQSRTLLISQEVNL